MLRTSATPIAQIDVNVGDLHLRVRGRLRCDDSHGEADVERGRNPFAGGSDSEGEHEGEGEGEWGADEDEVEGALALEGSASGEDVGEGGGEERLLANATAMTQTKAEAKRGRMRAIKAKLKSLPTHLGRLRTRTRKSSARCEEGAFVTLHGEEGVEGAAAAQNPFGDENAADTMDGCEWTTWNGFRDGDADADAEMASPPRTPTMDPDDGGWASFPVPQRNGMAGPPRTPSPSKSKSSSSPLRTSFSTTASTSMSMSSPSRTSYSRRSSMRTGSVHSSASKSSARKGRARSGSHGHGHGQGRRASANLKNGVSPEKVRQAAKRRGGWPPRSQLKLMQVLGHDAAGAVARTAGGGMSESALRIAHFEKTMKEQLRRQA